MSSNLNATSAALLGLLHEGSMTGGRLCVVADQRLGPFWTMTRSQIYRELPVLAEMGYVLPLPKGPRDSKPYTITALGKLAFSTWLSEPAGKDYLRNPLILRAAFGKLHTSQQLIDLYEDQLDAYTAMLEDLCEELLEVRDDSQADPFQVATLEFAVVYHRSVVKWLENAPRA